MLEGLQAKFEGFGEGAKAILGNKLSEVVSGGDVAIISKELKVQTQYTKALEVLLGPAMEALFVGDSRKALAVIGKLDADVLGRACLQVDIEAAASTPGLKLPDTIVPAASVVNVRDDALFAAVQRLLSGCYFTDSLGNLIAFWKANPGFNFLLVATTKGEVLDCRGLIHGGRTSGKKSSSVLEREAEIRTLRSEIAAGRKELHRLRQEATAFDDKCNAADAAIEAQRQRLGTLASEVSALVAEERGQQQKIEQNARSRQSNEEEIAGLDAHHGDSVKQLEEAGKELKAAEEGLATERKCGTDLEEAIIRAREVRDEKREALADVRLELAEKKQRLESFDRALGEVQRETASLQERILRRNQEIDTTNEQIAKLKTSAAAEVEKSVELDKTLVVATAQLGQDRESLKQMDTEISAADTGLTDRRNKSRSLNQELTKLEVRLAEERSQIGFIQSTAQDEYQIELSEVEWKSELWEANVEFENASISMRSTIPTKSRPGPNMKAATRPRKNSPRWTTPNGPRSKARCMNSKAASPIWDLSIWTRSANTPTLKSATTSCVTKAKTFGTPRTHSSRPSTKSTKLRRRSSATPSSKSARISPSPTRRFQAVAIPTSN